MDSSKKSRSYILVGIRWLARILGTLLAALVLVIVVAHAIDGNLPGLLNQPLVVQIQFAAMLAMWIGVIIGWKSETIGGLLALGGVIVFHIVQGKIWLNGLFGLFALTGALYLLCWFMKKSLHGKSNENE